MKMKIDCKIKVLAKRAKRARGWLTIKINIYIQNCIARFRYGLVFRGSAKRAKSGKKRAKRGKKACKKWQAATLVTRLPTQIGGENRARGTVQYMQETDSGSMRQPVWKGLKFE